MYRLPLPNLAFRKLDGISGGFGKRSRTPTNAALAVVLDVEERTGGMACESRFLARRP